MVKKRLAKLAIMQPYFLPYIGYFQLIKSADLFVVYDNIKYTKKGWINRNRFLQGGAPAEFTIPIKKDSDHLDVRDRAVSPDFDRARLLNRLREAYTKAPNFEATFGMIERIVMNQEPNLFEYIFASIKEVCREIGLKTELIVSSTVGIDHSLRSQEKVLAICRALRATTYFNAIGGRSLYSVDAFSREGVELRFLQPTMTEYPQYGNEFVSWLSIIDVLMFNGPSEAEALLGRYELV